MAALDDLLARIQDEALRDALKRELALLRGERELGLVFERHLPEKVRLPGLPVRRGTTVEVRTELPAPTWQVTKVTNSTAELRRRGDDGSTLTETYSLDELVVVREFGQPIYPGLKSVGRIERGGDKPFHTVINAENYHALELLLYTCEGRVDAIYIDPPYNTGARDWKYNNNYVDGNDGYRHSKWLSFMEKRLLLAKRLLNPDNSVLIVTIDEKEYLRLGLLLQQMFPGARSTMVCSNINPGGSTRKGTFSRATEYIYFVQLGSSEVQPLPLSEDWDAVKNSTKADIHWHPLQRTGQSRGNTREGRPNLFYPVFVKDGDGGPVFDSVGEAIGAEVDPLTVKAPTGCEAVWPIRKDGSDGCWGSSPDSLRNLISQGYARLGQWNGSKTPIYYLQAGMVKKVESGQFSITGHRPDGSITTSADGYQATFIPEDMWRIGSHDASRHGSNLLSSLVPGRKFPFPKSLYAVEDALRFFLKDKPAALVVDFFGGSGTTAHAVMRLNRQDDGRRRSIVVTNNEIGPDAEKSMTATGKKPGDPEWESLGIFEYITKPRLEAAVTGKTHTGEAVVGAYKFTDEFPMSDGFVENIEFFALAYENADRVRLGAAFASVAPMLWLMAGAEGPRVENVVDGWALPEGGKYGVLFDADGWPGFVEAVKAADAVSHAFVVTDSDAVFQRVVAELPDAVTPARLYESYLQSFALNTGVSA